MPCGTECIACTVQMQSILLHRYQHLSTLPISLDCSGKIRAAGRESRDTSRRGGGRRKDVINLESNQARHSIERDSQYPATAKDHQAKALLKFCARHSARLPYTLRYATPAVIERTSATCEKQWIQYCCASRRMVPIKRPRPKRGRRGWQILVSRVVV